MGREQDNEIKIKHLQISVRTYLVDQGDTRSQIHPYPFHMHSKHRPKEQCGMHAHRLQQRLTQVERVTLIFTQQLVYQELP